MTGVDNESIQSGQALAHESAALHVSGCATFVDDQLEPQGLLHASVGVSDFAHGNITAMDLTQVQSSPGVVSVLAAEDIPGKCDIGPVFPGDKLLSSGLVEYHGQPLFVVAAKTRKAAERAVEKARISYQKLAPVLTAKQALSDKSFVRPSYVMATPGETELVANGMQALSGSFECGGQEHFYLEGQVSMAIPAESGGMYIYSSSQHPSEVQHLVASVLGIDMHRVVVVTRRMGGGFGGKETQAAPWACLAAMLAQKTGRPVKFRLGRCRDMQVTGKRHPFSIQYQATVDQEGGIAQVEHVLTADCGATPDLSDAIVDRAMFHADNAYFLPRARVVGHRCKTNKVSNTAFRGFGGPQGMLAMEALIEDIARDLGVDSLSIRKKNLYGDQGRDHTHYGQRVEFETLKQIIDRLENSADYWARRAKISAFNAANTVLKKGLSLTPVKFGISFTAKHLNQAGALVHVYTDGSIMLNHGGTEMGQGLFIKVAQIVADVFGQPVSAVAVSATQTDKVPNTSPTAASSGTDINGMAARNAALAIRRRLQDFASEHYAIAPEEVRFSGAKIMLGDRSIEFAELVKAAYFARVQLSATGFYKTPEIHFDRESASGQPFFYYANGAACSEVIIDTLTGESKCLRVDILHDVGDSINPAIDIGQIEGGFIQGMGWLTSEELVWDDEGRLLTNAASTYKIPAIGDTPEVFNVDILQSRPNQAATIFRSKAVGEPPFMLAISVWCAIREAIASVGKKNAPVSLNVPATPESILTSIANLVEQN